jgi:hypothetical protein
LACLKTALSTWAAKSDTPTSALTPTAMQTKKYKK